MSKPPVRPPQCSYSKVGGWTLLIPVWQRHGYLESPANQKLVPTISHYHRSSSTESYCMLQGRAAKCKRCCQIRWGLSTPVSVLKRNVSFYIEYHAVVQGITVESNGKCDPVLGRRAQTNIIYLIL